MITFVNTFIKNNSTKSLLLKAPGTANQGVLVKMYVDGDRCVYSYTSVRSRDGRELGTDKENMELVRTFSDVSVDLMECLVRFDKRFDRWLTGQAELRSLVINDSTTTTISIGEEDVT